MGEIVKEKEYKLDSFYWKKYISVLNMSPR